jgi:hypothetical protein
MSTRSLTHVKDEAGRTLVTFYRQGDGYPTGHGKDLADFSRPRFWSTVSAARHRPVPSMRTASAASPRN